MKVRLITVAVGVLLILAAASAAAKGAPEYWPGDRWRTSTPEAQGFSSSELAKAFDFIQAEQVNIHSMLIVRNGSLILEAYFHA